MAKFVDFSVVPSYFSMKKIGRASGYGTFNTSHLLQGEVKELILPTSPKSKSGKYTEYSVAVEYRQDDGPATSMLFTNCFLINTFGGLADRVSYTLRSDPTEVAGETFGVGTKVLLLCLNGEMARPYIIGGIRDDSDTDSDSGHNLFFEFNGVQFLINDDGELTCTYHGKTQVDGSLDSSADSEAEGSTIKITKDGHITLHTKDEAEKFVINHTDKRIYTTSEEGVHLGDATDDMVLGTTYRTAENTCNSTLKSKFASLKSELQTASTQLNIASSIHKIPVSGPIVGSSMLGQAASALGKAASLAQEMSDAIEKLEKDAETYLSKKNKLD